MMAMNILKCVNVLHNHHYLVLCVGHDLEEDMATRPTPIRTRRAAIDLGEHIRTWRKLLGLTAEQLAERVGVNRGTISRLERGDVAVSIGVFLSVTNALGQLDNVVKSVDPYETPLGRARSDEVLPQRVRQ